MVLSTWVVALPHKIIDFNAEQDQGSNNLYWKIINDENYLQLSIQRSSDGENFNSIATLQSEAAPDMQKYLWRDSSPRESINYYRIQFINSSGGIFYTDVVKINNGKILPAELRVSPVPFNQNLNIWITLNKNEKVTCKMIDINGEVIYTTPRLGLKGKNQFVIDGVSAIPAGNYILQVQTRDHVYNKVIIKNQ